MGHGCMECGSVPKSRLSYCTFEADLKRKQIGVPISCKIFRSHEGIPSPFLSSVKNSKRTRAIGRSQRFNAASKIPLTIILSHRSGLYCAFDEKMRTLGMMFCFGVALREPVLWTANPTTDRLKNRLTRPVTHVPQQKGLRLISLSPSLVGYGCVTESYSARLFREMTRSVLAPISSDCRGYFYRTRL
ncbi:hypothetical protein J6590_106243 [Homalodisca vitripennis]|nr:hypothetical protein J6590_106243 [Homalodisca vitripennis]